MKLSRLQIALLVTGAALIFDEIQLLRGQSMMRKLQRSNMDASELLTILAKKIEAHPDIEFDDFEVIVMNDIFSRNK